MKLVSGVEQAIYTLVILDWQQEGVPLKSAAIAKMLGVSESYLRKVTRKLVVAGLASSKADRAGGLSLARPLEAITYLDVVRAVEPDGPVYDPKVLRVAAFSDTEAFAARERQIAGVFDGAIGALDLSFIHI